MHRGLQIAIHGDDDIHQWLDHRLQVVLIGLVEIEDQLGGCRTILLIILKKTRQEEGK